MFIACDELCILALSGAASDHPLISLLTELRASRKL
jgi:hypothetical protein